MVRVLAQLTDKTSLIVDKKIDTAANGQQKAKNWKHSKQNNSAG